MSDYSLNTSQIGFQEEVEGNPWSVVPIKTRLYAKETKEIVLSKRKITHLINFEEFENLEALWLNQNKLKKFTGLDTNFRMKMLILSKNNLITLDGSLSIMKFLKVLFLDNNKLRKLDKQLDFLRKLPFLENLNLFGNPLAEEPEYRYRVIYNLASLDILDRHKITDDEKTKADKIVPEYMNPTTNKQGKKGSNLRSMSLSETSLEKIVEERKHPSRSIQKILDSKKKVLGPKRAVIHSQKILMKISSSGLKNIKQEKKGKNKKIYEKASITEKEMFIEADAIMNRRKKIETLEKVKKQNEKIERELTLDDLPHNKEFEKNEQKYYKEDCYDCPELEINDIRRLFNLYDPSKFNIKN